MEESSFVSFNVSGPHPLVFLWIFFFVCCLPENKKANFFVRLTSRSLARTRLLYWFFWPVRGEQANSAAVRHLGYLVRSLGSGPDGRCYFSPGCRVSEGTAWPHRPRGGGSHCNGQDLSGCQFHSKNIRCIVCFDWNFPLCCCSHLKWFYFNFRYFIFTGIITLQLAQEEVLVDGKKTNSCCENTAVEQVDYHRPSSHGGDTGSH